MRHRDVVDHLAGVLIRPINPALIVVLGLYTIVWGLWIMSPFWSVFQAAPLYLALSHSASEYVWGGIAVVVGGIITRGALKPIYWNLDIGSLIGFMFWLTISIFYFISDWMNTGGITSLMLAVYCALIWLNVRTNKELYGYDPEYFHRHGK